MIAITLRKIEKLVNQGWIVSVDLIYGLPGQHITTILTDIECLTSVKVHGFSLYELQISSRNKGLLKRAANYPIDKKLNYLLFHSAEQILTKKGYQKTAFNHFCLPDDKNLYFSFPERGEDCLSLGTIADGVFGAYHYRHKIFKAYCDGVVNGSQGLAGVLRRDSFEDYIWKVETALLSARIRFPMLEDLYTIIGEPFKIILRQWVRSSLLREETKSGDFVLTENGSWFIGEMIQQTRGLALK